MVEKTIEIDRRVGCYKSAVAKEPSVLGGFAQWGLVEGGEEINEESQEERKKMYVTRNASFYKNFPELKQESPPEGPGSGILVIQDEEFEAEVTTCCFGTCRDSCLHDLPFPQNRRLTIAYTSGDNTDHEYVYFIPVLGKSLSLNHYYVIVAEGKHRGEASTCSKEEDMTTGCFGTSVSDVKPTIFNPDSNMYQQIEVIPSRTKGCYSAKSVTSDGFPHSLLRMNGWTIYTKSKPNCHIEEALGIIRSPMVQPPVDTSHSSSTRVLVGKWCCPFIFVREEGVRVAEQLDRTMYYEMTLEQYWEEIYASDDDGTNSTTIDIVKVFVQNPRTFLYGDKEAEGITMPVVDGVRWFRPILKSDGSGLGLSTEIVERMRWEQRRRGWVESDLVEERVEKSGCSWKKFRFFVLVERFVLKRMDGSVVFTCAFKHTNKVSSTWE